VSHPVRVRFAPSPTGPLHIGGARTALFNYLFTKKHQGTFVLRIEDTDQTRYVPGAEEYIETALNWLDIPYDEGPKKPGSYGPYRQSERGEHYKTHIQKLIDSGWAYYAFDSQESLAQLRKEAEKGGQKFIYNAKNRLSLQNALAMTPEQTKKLIDDGAPYVVRFKSPENRKVICNDLIRGTVTVDSNALDDKILFKSDGMPTYHLANVVDDHLMHITHVIRGEEWLPSMALHVLLYQAFGWPTPEFAHLPLILKPTGKGKLSKRDGVTGGFPVFPLQWEQDSVVLDGYREQGYVPGAVVNLLALLGWNSGSEREVFDLSELIEHFSLERVQKSGAKFDPDKALWFQNHYFQRLSNQELIANFSHWLSTQGKDIAPAKIAKVIPLVKDRVSFTKDFWEACSFFFEAPQEYDPSGLKRAVKANTLSVVTELTQVLDGLTWDSGQSVSEFVKHWCANKEIGIGAVMMPLRLFLVGAMKGPDIFDIMMTLGKSESLERLNRALVALAES
jgi:glutamyl-tRNA synthetase